jgi:multidrug resistance protein, MATE family
MFPDSLFRLIYGEKSLNLNTDHATASFHPNEASPLLGSACHHDSAADVGVHSNDYVEHQEQNNVLFSNESAAWLGEAKTIASYALPVTFTFLLQDSVNTMSLIAAGRIGKFELGAVSC